MFTSALLILYPAQLCSGMVINLISANDMRTSDICHLQAALKASVVLSQETPPTTATWQGKLK
jgi:hypothetical protein